jgi:hypothetical protein
MAYTFENYLISDLHKEAYGFRPTQRFFDDWATYTDAEKQEVWDSLVATMQYEADLAKEVEAQSLSEFRERVRMIMNVMSCGWKRAVEALAQAEKMDLSYEFDYFLWGQGLGFDDRKKIQNLFQNK